MAHIRVGSIAIAKRASGGCRADELGVCYDVYELEGTDCLHCQAVQTVPIDVLRNKTPLQVFDDVKCCAPRYVQHWDDWLAAPAHSRPRLFGEILRPPGVGPES
jgi:hypothetical protein